MLPTISRVSSESTPLLTSSIPASSVAPAQASHLIQGYGGVICDGISASSSVQAGTVMVLAGDQPSLPPQLESAGNSHDTSDLKEVHLTNQDGTEWKGTYRQGRPWNGSGTRVSAQGTIKRGTWIDGKVEGDYVEIGKEGRYWIGTFKNGRPWCGHGTLVRKSSKGIRTEIGTWIKGKREGPYTSHSDNGRKWEGICKNDLPWDGKGCFRYSEGYMNRTENEWKEGNLVTGVGGITNPDGSMWVGELYKGRPKTGKGTWYDVNGNRWTGEWLDFESVGKIAIVNIDQTSWLGSFKRTDKYKCPEDVKLCDAEGTYYYPDKMGGCISGTWVGFDRHGEFTIIDSENNVWQGVYAHDQIVSGKGKMLRSDGHCWEEGEWISYGRIYGLNGRVTITNRNGTTWIGEFRNFQPWNGSGTYRPSWSSEGKTGTWVDGVFQDKDAIRQDEPSAAASSNQSGTPTAPRRAPRPTSSSSATVTARSTQPRPTATSRGVSHTPPAGPVQDGCSVQ